MVKRITAFLISTLVFSGVMILPGSNLTSQAYNMPEYIRVALKYEGTAETSVVTKSDTGGSAGTVLSGVYTPVASFANGDTVTVVFDSRYHIQIGGEFNTYDEAKTFIEVLKNHAGGGFNLTLFPVFTGKWIVCASLYSSPPIEGVTYSDQGIDEFKILLETFAVPVSGKPSYTVVPVETTRFAMRVAVNGVPVFAVSDSANNTTVRILPTVPQGSSAVPLLRSGSDLRARYRGMFDIHRQTYSAKDNFVLVNRVKLEEYLYSVVPAEMAAGSDSQYAERIEALKVQAICARTFAVKFIEASAYAKVRADVDNSTNTQVYQGYTTVAGNQGEWNNTTKAVDQTTGKVLLYGGKLAQYIYYHSHSGGYTEMPQNVWGSQGPFPPYVVSKEDAYSTHVVKNWSGTYTGKSLQSTFRAYILATHSVDVGKIKYINVVSRSASGRVTGTLVEGTANTYTVQWERNRWMLSLGTSSLLYTYKVDDKLKIISQRDGSDKFLSGRAKKVFEGEYFSKQFLSDTYSVTADGKTYERLKIYDSDSQQITVNGKGTGHGIGMSQVGAEQMSRLYGKKAEEIIQFYYPGLEIG